MGQTEVLNILEIDRFLPIDDIEPRVEEGRSSVTRSLNILWKSGDAEKKEGRVMRRVGKYYYSYPRTLWRKK